MIDIDRRLAEQELRRELIARFGPLLNGTHVGLCSRCDFRCLAESFADARRKVEQHHEEEHGWRSESMTIQTVVRWLSDLRYQVWRRNQRAAFFGKPMHGRLHDDAARQCPICGVLT